MTYAETLKSMFDEVVNLGKLDAVDDWFDPAFEMRTTTATFDRDGFREFVAGWRAAFPDLHVEVSDVLAEGDRVAWAVRATGTQTGEFMGIPATGRSVDFDSLNIAEFRDGKAYRHRVVMDETTMMRQLGLIPDPPPA